MTRKIIRIIIAIYSVNNSHLPSMKNIIASSNSVYSLVLIKQVSVAQSVKAPDCYSNTTSGDRQFKSARGRMIILFCGFLL